MCLPNVKTAIEEPWTTMEQMTRKHVMGQINSMISRCGKSGEDGNSARGVVSSVSSSARARMATKSALPIPHGGGGHLGVRYGNHGFAAVAPVVWVTYARMLLSWVWAIRRGGRRRRYLWEGLGSLCMGPCGRSSCWMWSIISGSVG